MKIFSRVETGAVEELIRHFKPQWYDATIDNADAPFPRGFIRALGMNMVDAMMLCLREAEDDSIRRQCAHEIWFGLPDELQLHAYDGFHIICNALKEDSE